MHKFEYSKSFSNYTNKKNTFIYLSISSQKVLKFYPRSLAHFPIFIDKTKIHPNFYYSINFNNIFRA